MMPCRHPSCLESVLLSVMLVAVAAVPAGGGEPLTLDNLFATELFASPLPTDVLWLPDGSGFVGRSRRGGVDGLWRYEVAPAGASLLVAWEDLQGRLASLRPDAPAAGHHDPNTHPRVGAGPAISPDGRLYLAVARNDVFVLELASGRVRYLTDDPAPERFPTFSPDGKKVAFVRDGDLFVIDTAGGAERRLTDRGGDTTLLNGEADWVYEEELDIARSFAWSPDGSRIAYVQYDTSAETVFPILDQLRRVSALELQRYPQAGTANARVRLGVVPVAGGDTTWLPTGVGEGYLARMGWTPEGSELWFEVLDRDQNRLELRVGRVGGSTSRRLLMEQSDTWVDVHGGPLFVGEDRFLWVSERDGWPHLYLYRREGTLERRLTAGEWEVAEVYGLDHGRRRVILQGVPEDPRQRQLYAVDLLTAHLEQLSTSPGTHRGSLSPGGRFLLDTSSTAGRPPRLDLYDAAGEKVYTVDDGRIPALEDGAYAPPEFGTVRADDGTMLYSWMFRPPDFDPRRRYPVLVYVYGGPGSQQVVDSWGGSRFLYYSLLARKGLIVFCVDNRGTGGRGHAFEAVVYRRLGEWELRDQLAGVRHLKGLPYVDPDRIGVYGGSYGGYMALLCMNRAPDAFSAGIAYAPVTDWRLYDTIYTERYMDRPQDNPEGYRTSAPQTWAGGLAGPLLICHGTMDNNVHLQNTVQMVEAYLRADKPLFELMLYPGVRHPIRTSTFKLQFHRLMVAFLEHHLLDRSDREASAAASAGSL